MAYLKVYLTNLGKYNEGELIGEWVDLPVSDEELKAVFNRIGINDYYEEYFITDYETDIDGLYIGEYENISYLNDLAEDLAALDEWDLKKFENAVEAGFINLEDIRDFDPSRFYLYEDVDTNQDLGYAMIEDIYGDISHVPESVLESNFDYESFGREIRLEFNVWDWLGIDQDDTEAIAKACEMYDVDDIEDIDAYTYYNVSDDSSIGYAEVDSIGGLAVLGKDTLEQYFDYEGYGANLVNAGVGEFTSDGFIEDTER